MTCFFWFAKMETLYAQQSKYFSMNSMKILYFTRHNVPDCALSRYGSHSKLCSTWSIDFRQEYHIRTGHWINPHSPHDIGWGIRDNWEFRCDPVAIALVEEYGGAWASGNEHQTVEIKELPVCIGTDWIVQFEDEEERGDQRIVPLLGTVCMRMIEKFLFERDIETLRNNYEALTEFS